jgi:hypothetical protein
MSNFISNLQNKVRSVTTSERKKGSDKKTESQPEKKQFGNYIPRRRNAVDMGKKTDDKTTLIIEERPLPNIEEVKFTPSNSEEGSKSIDNETKSESASIRESSGSLEDLRRVIPETTQPPLTSIVSPRSNFARTRPSATAEQRLVISSRNPDAVARAKDAAIERRLKRLENKRNAFKRADAKILTTKTDIPSIRKNLPTGMIMDIHGNVSGQHTFTHLPKDDLQHSEIPIGKATQEVLAHELGKTTLIGKQMVVEFFTRDVYRLNYDIPTNDGQANPLPWPGDEQIAQREALDTKPGDQTLKEARLKKAKEALRSEQITLALRDFVKNDDVEQEDSDKAAFVLSSVLLQQVPTKVQAMVYGSHYGPSPYRCLSLKTARDEMGQDRPLTIMDSFGQEHPVVVKGLGDARFTLSRYGDDFRLIFDQPTYAEAKHGREDQFPLHKEGVIKIYLRTEIIVDGKMARQGKLGMTMPNGVEAEYSGRFKLD